jgi:hypothetical protein
LEREPRVKQRRTPDVAVSVGVLRHLKVCRKDRNEKRDEADPGESASSRNQYADSAEALEDAAYLNEQRVRRQVRRHYPHVKSGMYEVIAACRYKERSEQNSTYNRTLAAPSSRYSRAPT